MLFCGIDTFLFTLVQGVNEILVLAKHLNFKAQNARQK